MLNVRVVKTGEISVDSVASVRTCRLTVVIMEGVRDMWDRVTLHRISSISGIFGKLRPNASVTVFVIIPVGVNLFPECWKAGCQRSCRLLLWVIRLTKLKIILRTAYCRMYVARTSWHSSSEIFNWIFKRSGPGSSVGIATCYWVDVPRIESRWWAIFSAPVQTGPGAHPASCTMGTGSFPGVKSGRGVTLTPHPLPVPLVMKE